MSNIENKTSVVYVQGNLYDRQRAYAVVFNYQREEELEFELKSVFPGSTGEYKIYRAHERWLGDDAVVAKGALPVASTMVKVGTDLVSSWIVVANDGKDTTETRMVGGDACPRFDDGCGKLI